MRVETQSVSPAPLLFRAAMPRVSSPEIPGLYDSELKVWVVEVCGDKKPIVDACDGDIMEITTKTRVRQEADDEAVSDRDLTTQECYSRGIAELVTKTEVQQESDDQIDALGLAEMVTNTAIVQERDDYECVARSLVELETKTYADLEHDDQTRMLI